MSAPIFPPFISGDLIEKHPQEITINLGGINCKSQDDAGVLAVVAAFAKKVASKLLQGQYNFTSMQRPTLLSLPESHLQMLSREYILTLQYFLAAGQLSDPVNRLKLIVAGIISNMAFNPLRSKGKGPVNPTLGETLSVY